MREGGRLKALLNLLHVLTDHVLRDNDCVKEHAYWRVTGGHAHKFVTELLWLCKGIPLRVHLALAILQLRLVAESGAG